MIQSCCITVSSFTAATDWVLSLTQVEALFESGTALFGPDDIYVKAKIPSSEVDEACDFLDCLVWENFSLIASKKAFYTLCKNIDDTEARPVEKTASFETYSSSRVHYSGFENNLAATDSVWSDGDTWKRYRRKETIDPACCYCIVHLNATASHLDQSDGTWTGLKTWEISQQGDCVCTDYIEWKKGSVRSPGTRIGCKPCEQERGKLCGRRRVRFVYIFKWREIYCEKGPAWGPRLPSASSMMRNYKIWLRNTSCMAEKKSTRRWNSCCTILFTTNQ